MASTNSYDIRRPQVPDIRIDSSSVSDPARFETDYSMYYPTFMPAQEGYEPSNIPELSQDSFCLAELESLFNVTQQPEPYEFLTGPSEAEALKYVPPSSQPAIPQNASINIPVFMPSPSSSYSSLSPGYDSPQSPWSPPSPSSDGSMSPMVSPLVLSRRGSSASLRHHRNSPSDSMVYGHTLQPPPTGRHSRSLSESSSTRPIASQAMIEANQKRRRHEASHRCEECGQTFTAIFSLKRHAQSHTGVKPFTCRIDGCGQAFFNQSDCRRHEKSKKRHKGLPYTLPVTP